MKPILYDQTDPRQEGLEVLVQCARDRMQATLDYQPRGWDEREGLRGFKAYSLRENQAGDLLLMGENLSGGLRAYRVDGIQSVHPTVDTYEPREGYVVELDEEVSGGLQFYCGGF